MSLIKSLKDEMKDVKEDMIDKGYLNSEEFFDLVLIAFEAASRTRDIKKIKFYAKILKNSFTKEKDAILPEEYINILKEMNKKEIEVAGILFQYQGNNKIEEFENDMAFAKECGWDQLQQYLTLTYPRELSFIFLRLERSGLIKEITGTYMSYDGGIYIITDTFRDLMDFLE